MFISWTFENKEVEVFEFEGKVLFNPHHVGDCLGIKASGVKKAVLEMNNKKKKLIKNSEATSNGFRKVNNRGENFLKTLMWIQVTLDN